DRFMQRQLVRTVIKEVPNRCIEEIDPPGFGLPIGQAIVGHAHKDLPMRQEDRTFTCQEFAPKAV
nr:hypothetical protein [Ktedonobacteraceae bacterium]